jgi:transcriptional regulator with XRE-family HTH domain
MAKAVRITLLLARNVRRLREAKGFSQAALAADSGLYQALISQIENELANPELDTLERLAAALGVHPRELFED